jgi:hypothetical protein
MLEAALATIAAVLAFKALFPDFDPGQFEGLTLPPLFPELWEIHTTMDVGFIPQCLAKFQSPSEDALEDVPEDAWVDFVMELSLLAGVNLTRFLGKVRPIPMNVQTALDRLPFSPDSSSAPVL